MQLALQLPVCNKDEIVCFNFAQLLIVSISQLALESDSENSWKQVGWKHHGSGHDWIKLNNAPQILGGSFSSVWTATIARPGSFFSVFRDLQDLHTLAPLRSQKFSYKSSKFLRNWILNIQFSSIFGFFLLKIWHFSVKFWWILIGISRQTSENDKICRDFAKIPRNNSENCRNCRNFRNYSIGRFNN